MKRAFVGVVLSLFCLTGCPSSISSSAAMCTKAVDNIMAKCGTCFATSTSLTSSKGSASCRRALMDMCGSGSSSSRSSSSSSASSPDAFLACVANATSCDGILLCN
jgi:hypothetical protein